jgi:hypothetical protein
MVIHATSTAASISDDFPSVSKEPALYRVEQTPTKI